MIIEVKSPEQMIIFGQKIGSLLKGGEVIELVGDVGAGKTTLTKGIALGLGINDAIQSPTFTINRLYPARDDLTLVHYDFYRLHDAGVMAAELHEVVSDSAMITIVEWGEVVAGVLPESRTRIAIVPTAEDRRQITIESKDDELLVRLNKTRQTE
jgi:tRNA threonylcarbamoyladenosine biosynthesis protein TsaE